MGQTGVEAFHYDLFIPRYRQMTHGDWALTVAPFSIARGYWTGPVLVSEMAVLLRDGSTWMSMTPFELESQEIGVRLAQGNVLIFGLGMGWSAMASALKPEVVSVTVVERDADVLALHRELHVFEQLPAWAQAKLRIVEGDAYEYVPDGAVDLLMPDIWLPLVSDGRTDEVHRMQHNVRAQSIYFWGQEMEIARYGARAGRGFDHGGLRATVTEMGLPLLGLEWPNYPDLVATVARRWMKGRWFSGSEPTWPERAPDAV